MFIATVILVAGKRLYVFKPPQGNITAQVCGGILVKRITFNLKSSQNLLRRFSSSNIYLQMYYALTCLQITVTLPI